MKMCWESGINQKYEFQGLSTISCNSTNKSILGKVGKHFGSTIHLFKYLLR